MTKIEIEITVHIHHHGAEPRRPVSAPAKKPCAALLQIIEDMGESTGSCRTWARDCFASSGLRVLSGTGNTADPYVVVHPQTQAHYLIPVYATVTLKKSTGQVGFTVGGLDREDFEWYGFVAQPFGKMYLRKRLEIVEGVRRRKKVRDRAYISFSPGPEENLYENRIHELLGDVP